MGPDGPGGGQARPVAHPGSASGGENDGRAARGRSRARGARASISSSLPAAGARSITTLDIFGAIPDPQNVRDDDVDILAAGYDSPDGAESDAESAAAISDVGSTDRETTRIDAREVSRSPELRASWASPRRARPTPKRRETATSAVSVSSSARSISRSPFQTNLRLQTGDVQWEVEQVLLPEQAAGPAEEEDDDEEDVKNVTWADGYDASLASTTEEEDSELQVDEDLESSSAPGGERAGSLSSSLPRDGSRRARTSSISRSPIFRVTGIIVAPPVPDIDEETAEDQGYANENAPLLAVEARSLVEGEPGTSEQDFTLDEDIRLFIQGYRERWWRLGLYWLLVLVSGGTILLAAHWFPTFRLRLTSYPAPFTESTHVLIKDNWGLETIEVVDRIPFDGLLSDVFPTFEADEALPFLTVFLHRTHRFILNPVSYVFETTDGWQDPAWDSTLKAASGLASAVAALRFKVFGPNTVTPPEPSGIKILFQEILTPFYIFQVFSILLWLWDSYQLFATAIFVISVVGIAGTLIETRSTMRRIRELSTWNADVWVFRAGKWLKIETRQLLPGDVVEIPGPNPNWFPPVGGAGANLHPHDTGILPADCILLSGEAIVTESMLTGESIPVTKSAVSDELASLDLVNVEPTTSQAMQRWFLFSGTKVVRVKAAPNPIFTTAERLPLTPHGGLLALVVRTGFSTTKGALTRSILFPKPGRFSFYEDSIKFIKGMSIVAILGFVASLYNFVRLGVSISLMIRRGLDLITVVVPPALPAAMGIGAQLALSRLRRHNIFCTSPPRINVAGKLDAWVFDKTGTLTGESLEVLGVRGVCSANGQAEGFTDLYREEPPTDYNSGRQLKDDKTTTTLLLEAMASCHGIKVVSVPSVDQKEPGELVSVPVGDPMDLQMFGWTGFEIEEGGGVYSSKGSGNRTPSKDQPGMGDLVPMVVRPPGQIRLDWSGIESNVEVAETVPKSDLVVDIPANGESKETAIPKAVISPTELGVVRTLEFSSALRRMTVIVRRVEGILENGAVTGVKAAPTMECFVKGAPEVLLDICREDSVPANYTDLLREYTHHGYRAIAVAWKQLPPMPFHRMLRMDRGAVECDLRFLGFIVFENKMKPTTPAVIKALKDARMRQAMCTGDNLLTAISVSKECGIVAPDAKVFVPRFVKGRGDDWGKQSVAESDDGVTEESDPEVYGGHTRDARLIWEDVDAEIEEAERGMYDEDDSEADDESEEGSDLEGADGEATPAAMENGVANDSLKPTRRRIVVLDPHTFHPVVLHSMGTSKRRARRRGSVTGSASAQTSEPESGMSGGRRRRRLHLSPRTESDSPIALTDYTIAVTGDVFEWMMAFAPREVAHRMLAKTRIYARFSPEQKQALVERLQSMHYAVGFCGDGANDVGALKSADVGVSLSEAEASVAAPFTSRSVDLACVLTVVREGRAALVTSFSSFAYMALYSIIQFVSVTLLYSFKGNLGDMMYLYIDLATILPLALCMGWTEPADVIHPKNPTSNLFSKKFLASLAGQGTIMAAFQIFAFFWVRGQGFYEPPEELKMLRGLPFVNDDDEEDSVVLSYEGTVLFLIANFQYVLGAVVFSIGWPFRKAMWTNVGWPSIGVRWVSADLGSICLSFLSSRCDIYLLFQIPFMSAVALLVAFNTLMVFGSPEDTPFAAPIFSFMELLPLPFTARIQLFGMISLNAILAISSEWYLWPALAKLIGRLRGKRTMPQKIWKGVEREMRIVG